MYGASYDPPSQPSNGTQRNGNHSLPNDLARTSMGHAPAARQLSFSTPGSDIPARKTVSGNTPDSGARYGHQVSNKRSHDAFSRDSNGPGRESKKPKLERLENERQALVRSIVGRLDREALEDIIVAAGLSFPTVMSDIIAGKATSRSEPEPEEDEQFDEQQQNQYDDDDKYQDYPAAIDDDQFQDYPSGAYDDDDEDYAEHPSAATGQDASATPQNKTGAPRSRKSRKMRADYKWPPRVTPPIIDKTWHVPTSGTVPVGILKGHPNVVNAGFDKRMTFNWRVTRYDEEGKVVPMPESMKGKGAATRREHIDLHPSLEGLGKQEFYAEVIKRQWANEE